MNLGNKKALASRTLNVGKGRIRFVDGRLEEIKEAITSQDMINLLKSGAIQIKPIKGRKANVSRTTKRGQGKIKKKIRNTKRNYVIKTRKLRLHLKNLRSYGKISKEDYLKVRNEIRSSKIKSKSHLKEYLKEIETKWKTVIFQ